MDDIVKAALKKWPNVPHCHGWLALDARGDWYLRDADTQAAGPFPQSKGQRVVHDKLKAFIERNYEHDEHGAWFFQNGPQRVYVALEASPLVWGVRRRESVPSAAPAADAFEWRAHTGVEAHELRSAWLDEQGRLFIDTDQGFGLVRSMDMDAAADAIEAGLIDPQDCRFDELPARFGYLLQPQP
jgi:hypothetical protein